MAEVSTIWGSESSHVKMVRLTLCSLITLLEKSNGQIRVDEIYEKLDI